MPGLAAAKKPVDAFAGWGLLEYLFGCLFQVLIPLYLLVPMCFACVVKMFQRVSSNPEKCQNIYTK